MTKEERCEYYTTETSHRGLTHRVPHAQPHPSNYTRPMRSGWRGEDGGLSDHEVKEKVWDFEAMQTSMRPFVSCLVHAGNRRLALHRGCVWMCHTAPD
jgi:hypothetical protein